MSDNRALALLENRYLKAEQIGGGIDLGAHNRLQVEIQVKHNGSGGSICLQHAAVDEFDMYQTLGNTVSLATVQTDFQTHSNFTRYVRWYCDASVAGNPVVNVYVTAKDR